MQVSHFFGAVYFILVASAGMAGVGAKSQKLASITKPPNLNQPWKTFVRDGFGGWLGANSALVVSAVAYHS